MRNLWCLEKISILPLVISAMGIVPQSLFKNLKILDLGNTLVVEIQKGILYYYTLTGKKNGTLIGQQQIIPIIPILMYFDQEAMIANITLNISIGYFA
jgi:hypothetical protein